MTKILSPSGASSSFDQELIPEDALPEVEGVATSNNADPFADHGFQVDAEDSGPGHWTSSTDGGFQVEFVDSPSIYSTSDADDRFHMEFVDAPPRSWSTSTSQSSPELDVDCSAAGFQITLPTGPLSEVKVVGMFSDFAAKF